MFAAVLFDLDDTLISDELISRDCAFITALEVARDDEKAKAIAHSAEKEARALWASLPTEAAAYAQRIGHSAVEGMWATYDLRIPEEETLDRETKRIRPTIWQRAFEAHGVRGDPEAAARRFFHSRLQYPLFSDTNEVLARLRPLTKLGVVTNGVAGLQRRKYDGSGLAHWFDAVAVSGEVRIGKPERGIFEFICRELGVAMSDCLMVGDNPERDIQGGINAGMKTCWIDRGFRKSTVQADVTVKSLAECWNWITATRG